MDDDKADITFIVLAVKGDPKAVTAVTGPGAEIVRHWHRDVDTLYDLGMEAMVMRDVPQADPEEDADEPDEATPLELGEPVARQTIRMADFDPPKVVVDPAWEGRRLLPRDGQ